MARKTLPSKDKIFQYWEQQLILLGKKPEWADPLDCFCCGASLPVQRAHIIPHDAGGADTEENLHLLCHGCHQESEHYQGDMYWAWFKSKDVEEEFERRWKRWYEMSKILISENASVADMEQAMTRLRYNQITA
jgi:5-methylcytosine-specific restriction endonuclease McrA